MSTTSAGAIGGSGLETRLNLLVAAWELQAPEAKFAGMSLAAFKLAIEPSLQGRQRKRELHLALRGAVQAVAQGDMKSRAIANQIISGVKAETAFGPDSPLYRAMGFIAASERKGARPQPVQLA